MEKQLAFGIQPPKGVKAAWGARAIFHPIKERPPVIDLLWDRQDASGSEEDRLELLQWMDNVGIPALHEAALDMPTSSRETVTIERGKFTIQASPRGSHGYLYIGAWMK